jgi:hypothetical protein
MVTALCTVGNRLFGVPTRRLLGVSRGDLLSLAGARMRETRTKAVTKGPPAIISSSPFRRSDSPGSGMPLAIDIVQTGFAPLREQHFTTFGMASSTLTGAFGPPRVVRIQPAAINTSARGSPRRRLRPSNRPFTQSSKRQDRHYANHPSGRSLILAKTNGPTTIIHRAVP